jgi:hypothetical protein
VPKDASAAQQGILLGQRAAEAAPLARSDDQGGAGGHQVLDNIGLVLLRHDLTIWAIPHRRSRQANTATTAGVAVL